MTRLLLPRRLALAFQLDADATSNSDIDEQAAIIVGFFARRIVAPSDARVAANPMPLSLNVIALCLVAGLGRTIYRLVMCADQWWSLLL